MKILVFVEKVSITGNIFLKIAGECEGLGFKNILKKTSVNKFFMVWMVAPAFAFLMALLLTFLADTSGLLYVY